MNKDDKILKFYSLLPTELTTKSLDYVISSFSRTDSRKIKSKSHIDKLKIILGLVDNRVPFCTNMYETLHSNCDLELSNNSYQELLNMYTKENCDYLTIYIFNKFCIDDDFDNKYFDAFLSSKELENTLNRSWSADKPDKTNETKLNFTEENNMTTYIGRLEKVNGFYNFAPCAILENNQIQTGINFAQKFPIYGVFNLDTSKSYDAYKFLDNLNFDKLYCISIHDDELIGNINPLTGELRQNPEFQLDLSDCETDLNKKIKEISEYKIYEVVESKSDIIENIEFVNGNIAIDEQYFNDKVLLRYDDKFYGPYEIIENPYTNEKRISPKVNKDKNYICEFYSDIQTFSVTVTTGWNESEDIELALVNIEPEYEDKIPDKILLDSVVESPDFSLLENSREQFLQKYNNTPYFKDLPNDFNKQRFNRVTTMLSNVETTEEELKKVIFEIIKKQTEDSSDIENIVKSTNAYRELEKKLESEKLVLSNEKDLLEKEVETLNVDLDNCKKELSEQKNIEIYAGNADLEQKNQELENKVKDLETKNKQYKELNDINEEIKNQEAIKNYLDSKINKLTSDTEKIAVEFEATIKEKQSPIEIVKNAFDPYISNIMLEQAGEWCSEQEDNRYIELKNTTLNVTPFDDDEMLVDYLVGGVQLHRNYTRNDIINIFICFTQGFLTFFSGEPGTGKTSICNIISDCLGLDCFKDCKRYVPISVEKGWSSKRDLIGYFNPLTKKYDKNNGKLYDSLMLLNAEKKESKFPLAVLLDEANLSPIEHYWAEFMTLADKDFDSEDSYINIGLKEDIYIPQTLRFLATINNDQTTESLSPRLKDRAWIISLPDADIQKINSDKVANFKENKKPISWESLNKVFGIQENTNNEIEASAKEIYDLFAKYNMSVSPRIKLAISNYVSTAQNVMVFENGLDPKTVALDYAIIQKLLPKIDGHYENLKNFFTLLKDKCVDLKLAKTKRAIEQMIELQENNMGYCQYLG